MEYKIGEIIILPDGRRVEVVESNASCKGCIFVWGDAGCVRPFAYPCSMRARTDHKYIIYKEIKDE